MTDKRMIEDYIPVEQISFESTREKRLSCNRSGSELADPPA